MARRIVCLSLSLAVMLAACSANPTASPIAPTPEGGVATPTSAPRPTVMVPTASADTGVITGQLFFESTNRPMPGYTVYLAKATPLEPGDEYVISLKQQESPHNAADDEGRFAMAAPPGSYVLVIWTPIDSKVLADPDNPEREYAVELIAGETLDLGAVTVPWP